MYSESKQIYCKRGKNKYGDYMRCVKNACPILKGKNTPSERQSKLLKERQKK